ncbi:MAG: MgtC/SapB family protein [Candidatus Dadabacteria bacterium]|nr:MAG: MgtC/SapB family protein [Candidatus Dadabacteria bacterium]
MEPLPLLRPEFPALLVPVAGRMAVAFVCGALVGSEREWKGKPAGLRTNILICLGAALFTMGSEFMAKFVAHAPQESTRIAAQIVSGVGFIGAGAILRSGRGVVGLTTAATIWLVAAIGVVVGMGYWLVGLITAVMTVVTLVALGRVEKRLMGPCDMRTVEVELGPDRPVTLARLEAILESAHWPTRVDKIEAHDGGTRVRFTYCARHPSHRGILWDLGQILE